MQHIQNLIMFKGTALIKTNIHTTLRKFALKLYTSKLPEFNHDALHNNLGIQN